MMTPPMVGVPALIRWVDGRSSWIRCPKERRVRKRIHRGVTNSETRKATPPDSIRLSTGTSSQELARNGPIVERHHDVADGLRGLVSLAGHDDDVTGRGLFQRARDRASPIGVAVYVRGARHARHDGVDDRLRRLGT